MYFLSPVIIPLWNVTPRWVKVAGGFILALGLAVVYGRNKGFQAARDIQAKANVRAESNRVEKHNEIEKLDTTQLDKRLDKWMRD